METKSILQMARGAIQERVDLEMAKIIDNILDANTKATEKRKLVLTVTLQPDDERQTIGIQAAAKTTLAPTNAVATAIYITGEDGTGEITAVELVPNIPGQMGLSEGEQDAPAILKLIKFA